MPLGNGVIYSTAYTFALVCIIYFAALAFVGDGLCDEGILLSFYISQLLC